jgi:flagellar biosynthetic protein FliQ
MSPEILVEVGQTVLRTALIVGGPILAAAMAVGLAVSFLQTLTSIQEQTLTLVPKLVAVGVVLVLLSPWMLEHLTDLMVHILKTLPEYGRR